ncbi:MAG: class I SAM-dependent methyltransferase [bacterium]
MREQTKKEILKMVVRNYQNIADQLKSSKEKTLWPELIKIAGSIEHGRILDVGCGSGRIYRLFKDKQIKYVGVDNCDKMINLAKEQNLNTENKPEFIHGNILELNNIQQVNFDYLFCIDVLHHLPGKRLRLDALRQLKNKIKPGGEIILTVWNLWKQLEYRRLILKFLALKLFKKNKMDFGDILIDCKNHRNNTYSKCYYHAFTARELKKMIKQTGLKIKGFYKDKKTYYLMLTK